MMWIATLCMLAVGAWLFFNALNERRWVKSHSHDESVAADEGLFPALSRTVDNMRTPDGKFSAEQSKAQLAELAGGARERSARAGEWTSRQARAAALATSRSDGPVRRSVDKLGGVAGRLDTKVGAMRENFSTSGGPPRGSGTSAAAESSEPGLFERAVGKMARGLENVERRLDDGGKADGTGGGTRAPGGTPRDPGTPPRQDRG